MHDIRQFFAPDRYSAGKMVKSVNFVCVAPKAEQVCLVGDFNDWDPTSHPMQREPDGCWLLRIPLHQGHHHYLFMVDGKAALDARAQGIARNPQGERVSLMAVS